MSSCAPVRSLWICSRSATVIVGSSSMRTSPALTLWPSRTWIARTTPVSNGWMTLVRPLGMILPGAEATMSILPNDAQAKARQNRTIIVQATARPIGDGGVSTTSRAAGKNASSYLSRRLDRRGSGMIFLAELSADFMDPGLQAVERGIAAAGIDQIVMGAVLNEAARVDSHDPVGTAHGRQPMRDDEDGAALGDFLHILLDDSLALVIKRARCFIEDQDSRIGDERPGNGNPLL